MSVITNTLDFILPDGGRHGWKMITSDLKRTPAISEDDLQAKIDVIRTRIKKIKNEDVIFYDLKNHKYRKLINELIKYSTPADNDINMLNQWKFHRAIRVPDIEEELKKLGLPIRFNACCLCTTSIELCIFIKNIATKTVSLIGSDCIDLISNQSIKEALLDLEFFNKYGVARIRCPRCSKKLRMGKIVEEYRSKFCSTCAKEKKKAVKNIKLFAVKMDRKRQLIESKHKRELERARRQEKKIQLERRAKLRFERKQKEIRRAQEEKEKQDHIAVLDHMARHRIWEKEQAMKEQIAKEPDVWRFPFGEYMGKVISEVPKSYLQTLDPDNFDWCDPNGIIKEHMKTFSPKSELSTTDEESDEESNEESELSTSDED
jgi:uncharacterized protein (DUF3820 family)